MRPFKFHNACLWQIQQLCILLMVSLPWFIALNEAEGDKTFNLKIGFDLTHGSQEASSIKLKKIKENDPVPHSNGEENPKRILRAQDTSSSSSSIENKKVKSNVEMEMKALEDSSQSEDDSGDSSGDRRQRSTKGLRAEEYEAKAGPAVREAFDKDSETENSN